MSIVVLVQFVNVSFDIKQQMSPFFRKCSFYHPCSHVACREECTVICTSEVPSTLEILVPVSRCSYPSIGNICVLHATFVLTVSSGK